jgi:Cu/Ag efflux protein CusF
VALALVLGLTGSLFAETAVGKVTRILPDKNQLALTDAAGKEWLFTLREDGKVRIEDKAGQLQGLKQGTYAVVTYERKDGALHASKVCTASPSTTIAGKNVPIEGITLGRLKSVAPDKNQLVLTDPAGKDFLFTLVDTGKVYVNEAPSRLTNLKSGDQVSIAYARMNGGLYAAEINTIEK